MRIALLTSLLCLSLAALSVVAQEATTEEEVKIERMIVPVDGVHDFEVTGTSTLFRITVSTPSGGSIEQPKIEGTAQHIRSADVAEVAAGGSPIIGLLRREFTFRGTAAGKITITIGKKSPTSPTPVTETFHVTVK